MSVKLKRSMPPSRWRKIDLGPVGDFEIELRPPTFGEALNDEALRHSIWLGTGVEELCTARIEARLKAAVIGWRGVESEGSTVPFSWENLKAACELFGCFDQVLDAADDAFRNRLETELPNSAGLSGAGSAETAATKTNLTSAASPATSDSAASEGCSTPRN